MAINLTMLWGLAAAATCGFCASSFAALRRPDLLHKTAIERNRRFRSHAHIAHRGGAAEAPENTIAAFKKVNYTLNNPNMVP